MQWSGIFWAAMSVAFAVATFMTISPVSKDFMDPFVEVCTSGAVTLESTHEHHEWSSIGYPYVDHFLCLVTPFFTAVAEAHDIGRVMGLFVMGPLVAAFIFTGIESLRRKATGFVLFFPLVFLVGQVTSIAVAFPLLWLPSYFLSSNRFNLIYASPKNVGAIKQFGFMNSLDGVFFLSFATWALCVNIMFLFGIESFRSVWIAAFQFVPIAGLLVNLFSILYGINKDIREAKLASKTAIKLYKVFAVILLLVHLYNIFLAVTSKILSLYFFLKTPSSSPLSASLFLFLDGLSLSLSLGIFVLAEQGLLPLFQFLGLSILVGPGSSFLFLAIQREVLLMQEMEMAHAKEKKKQ